VKAVFLDAKTIGKEELLEPLQKLPIAWTFYPTTRTADIKKRIQDADIVVTNKVPLKGDDFNNQKLQLIAIPATGYDHIDLKSAAKNNIVVCNSPSYSTRSVAERVIAFIFALSSQIIPYYEDVQKGLWQQSEQFCLLKYPINEIKGKKLGVIGFGEIGREVKRLAEALSMEVLIATHPRKEIKEGIPLEQLIETADFITLHVPLNHETRNLLGYEQFKKMKSSACIINTSRGGVIQEKALQQALQEKIIKGAALDVLSKEPPQSDHPLLEKKLPNLIITPHNAWASIESRKRLMKMLAETIEAFLENKPIRVV
jgi:glycerate dehydrogenase